VPNDAVVLEPAAVMFAPDPANVVTDPADRSAAAATGADTSWATSSPTSIEATSDSDATPTVHRDPAPRRNLDDNDPRADDMLHSPNRHVGQLTFLLRPSAALGPLADTNRYVRLLRVAQWPFTHSA
jgi:hypothetical protein